MNNLYGYISEEARDNKLNSRKMMKLLCEFIEVAGLDDECLGYVSLACDDQGGDS